MEMPELAVRSEKEELGESGAARSAVQAWELRDLSFQLRERARESEAHRSRYEEASARVEELEEEVETLLAEKRMRAELESILRERARQLEVRAESEKSFIAKMQSELTQALTRARVAQAAAMQLKARLFQAEAAEKARASRTRAEIDSLKVRLANREDASLEALKSRKAALDRQEARLASFAELLSERRDDVLKHAAEAAELLQSAQGLNPLDGYLKVTELEITKIEKEAGLLAESSPRKAVLGRALEKLFEQREFLRSTIGSINRDWERLASRIATLGSEGAIPEVPPLPPRVALPGDGGKC
jgi:chromosome segregation ATPase